MRINVAHKNGFTLIEAVAALTLFVVAMSLALSGFMFFLKNSNQEDAQNELDMDVQQTMERLKRDLRLSSLDKVFYYADTNGQFQALSFPLGQDADGNGILDKDASHNIIWGSQIIYHIKDATPNELMRTVFSPRDPDLLDAQRQEQLEDVVASGDGNSTYNSENATSTMLFKNLLHWQILQTAGRYDAFDDTAYNIREEASLGYALISPGSHEFTFEVVDKNSRSNGRKIGIDQLYVSPSYGAREAERQEVTANSGALATPMEMTTGSWKGRYQLYFPAQNDDDSFTLTMDNDRWEESNFSIGAQGEDIEIVWDSTLSEYVVQLAGNKITWVASDQTGSFGSDTTNLTDATTARILLRGRNVEDNGSWLACSGNQCKLTFRASSTISADISQVFIGESNPSDPLTALGSSEPVKFSNNYTASIPIDSSRTSDWVDFSINKTNSYLVQFTVASGNSLKKWTDTYTSVPSYGIETNSTPQTVSYALGLESVFASYPTNGIYTSRIFDTHLDNPQYSYLTKNSYEPGPTSIAIEVRTGNERDLSDAPAWSGGSLNSSFAISANNKRYVQFQAILKPNNDGSITPKLRDVTIEWTGEERLVNIGGIFTKGTDYGIFEVSVDGNPLRSALIVELEIYKENVRGMNNENRTISSSLKVDMTPRNSGL